MWAAEIASEVFLSYSYEQKNFSSLEPKRF